MAPKYFFTAFRNPMSTVPAATKLSVEAHRAEQTMVATSSPAPKASLLNLPNEILAQIFSEIVGRDVILLDNENSPGATLDNVQLRLVCSHFRDTFDYLVANNAPKHIWLQGPIPIDDMEEAWALAGRYMKYLKLRLSPFVSLDERFEFAVHFVPDLSRSECTEVWRHGTREALPKCVRPFQVRDYEAARKAMTSHLAAALMLSRMLEDLVLGKLGARGQTHIRLVFHEVDGKSQSPDRLHEEALQVPKTAPFWDAASFETLLQEWQWICRVEDFNNHRSLGKYVTLPAIAWTSKSSASDRQIYEACAMRLKRAWDARKPTFATFPAATYHAVYEFVSIPGFRRPVPCPGKMYYAKWLTVLSWQPVTSKCWAIRGLGMYHAADKTQTAILLKRF